jgi:hypothetical protein
MNLKKDSLKFMGSMIDNIELYTLWAGVCINFYIMPFIFFYYISHSFNLFHYKKKCIYLPDNIHCMVGYTCCYWFWSSRWLAKGERCCSFDCSTGIHLVSDFLISSNTLPLVFASFLKEEKNDWMEVIILSHVDAYERRWFILSCGPP